MGKIAIRCGLALGILLTASCGGKTETDGSGATGSTAASTTGGDDCSMSFCGCSSDVTLMFEATVTNVQTKLQVEGIELYCGGEATPIAVTDVAGKISFSIETRESPGCGPERCLNLRFHDPTGPLADLVGTFYEYNGKEVTMQYKPD